jgi:hypothetical protein
LPSLAALNAGAQDEQRVGQAVDVQPQVVGLRHADRPRHCAADGVEAELDLRRSGKPRCIAHSPPLASSGHRRREREAAVLQLPAIGRVQLKVALPWHCSANAGRGNAPLAWVSAYGSATSGAALTSRALAPA